MALSINFGTYRIAHCWWFYFFSRKKKTTAVFQFLHLQKKSGLQDITCGDGVSSELSWWGFFFHETQVRWRPSEALRPVHDVVWKLNRLATKTEKTLLIPFVGACDWYGTSHLYVHIYIYWSIFCWQNLSWEYFLLLQLTHCVLTYHLKRGDAFSLSQGLTLNTLLNSCGN